MFDRNLLTGAQRNAELDSDAMGEKAMQMSIHAIVMPL